MNKYTRKFKCGTYWDKTFPSVIFMVCKFKMRGEYFKGRFEEMKIFSYLFLCEAKSKG
jgi:hypothetical protein